MREERGDEPGFHRVQRAAALWTLGALAAAALSALGGSASAQSYSTRRVASGLDLPVFLTAPPGDRQRAFVVEQHTGNILILRLSDLSILPTPFLTVPGVSTGGEQGLLGLAFHPDYQNTGFFYVYYTDPNTQVVRYRVSADPDVADATSATPVLSFLRPQSNHNGGWISFGPDGLLYIASGDGGNGNDTGPGHTAGTGNAQDVTDNLLGKILRIDVDGDDFPADPLRNYSIPPGNPFVGIDGDDEIFAFGLRNPWRSSFDRLTGDFYIGDVGQGACEEVDVLPRGFPAGANFGWRLREGVIETPTAGIGGPAPPGALDPIFDYAHSGSGCSDPGSAFHGIAVTGGIVYRGPEPALQGRYFFADYGTAHLWSLRWDGSNPASFDGSNYVSLLDHSGDPHFTPDVGSLDSVSSFGEDADGNLYVVDLDGEIFTVPEAGTPWLLGSGLPLLFLLARMRQRRHGLAETGGIAAACYLRAPCRSSISPWPPAPPNTPPTAPGSRSRRASAGSR